MLELEGALLEAEELLQAVDLDGSGADGAEGAVAALGVTYTCLRSYATAVQARCTQQGGAEGLRAAARLLANLIVAEGAREPTLPSRYVMFVTLRLGLNLITYIHDTRHWLHVLELIAWLCNCVAGAESEDGSAGAEMQDGSMEVVDGPSAPARTGAAAVFSKAQAYALLVALQELQTSYGAHDLIASAGSSSAGPAGLSSARLLQGLKLGLLGVLCTSLVADNAERCATKTEDNLFAKAGVLAYGSGSDGAAQTGYSYRRRRAQAPDGPLTRKQRGGDGDLQQAMAYEILTGAHLDM
jgi:hypothetical protein